MQFRGAILLAAAIAALAIMAPIASAKPVYGVVPQDGALPPESDLELMPGAGIGGIRLILHWASVESSPGQFDWQTPDAMVRQAIKHGIQPFFFIYGTPTWVAQEDGRICAGLDCSVYPPSSDAAHAAFARFAAAAAQRYGPDGDFWKPPGLPAAARPTTSLTGPAETLGTPCPVPIPGLCGPPPPPPPPPGPPPNPDEPPCQCTTASPLRAWQIWNEQNSPKYFAPKVDVKGYAAMVRSANTAIKSVDPGADVVLGGMWGPKTAKKVVTPVDLFLKRLYRVDGAKASFDSIALHPYAAKVKKTLEQVRDARAVARRSGDRKSGTWISELGWAADGPTENPYVKGLEGQARLLSRSLRRLERKARSFHLRGVFWYSWRDKAGGEAICEWCGHAGLRTLDGSAKPAWEAFARVTR